MLVQLRRLCAALLAAGAAVAPSSCARNDSSIFVFAALQANRSDCTVLASTSPMVVLVGSIDAAFAGEYTATLQVENQIVPRGNPNTLKTETSGVQLYDAEVQVLDPATNGPIAQFSVPVSGFVPPGSGGTPGLGLTEVVMIDSATVRSLRQKVISTNTVQEVVASVIVRGRTLGDLEVHTQEFLFPIQVFSGGTCFSPGATCVTTMASNSGSTTGVCRLGLDEQTSCQDIASTIGVCGVLECPLDPTTMRSNIAGAHCPAHAQPDNSCCNP
jgi:hypothetical protein